MPKKAYLIAIATIIIIAIIIAAAMLSSQNSAKPSTKAVSGLAPGDTFTYSIRGIADIIGENGTIPPSFSELNQTDNYQVTITSIDGGQITFNTTWRFVNGTERTSQGSGNILTGINDEQFWAIYPANLTLNALVRPLGTDGVIVNQTETRTYSYGPRIANIITLQNEFVNTDDPTLSTTYNNYLYVHFDKFTGMLVELQDIKIYNNPQVVLTVDWQLESTNVWSV